MDGILDAMRGVVERHCRQSYRTTAVPGLTLFRIEQTTLPDHVLYNPRILVILQGSKTVALGETAFRIDPATFIAVTVSLPVMSQIEIMPDGKPHMAFTVDLDRALLAEVLQSVSVESGPGASLAGLATAPMTGDLLESFMRLLKLLDRPAEIGFVRPLVLREIYFRLLQSGLGASLAQFALNSSHVSQISRATEWIKSHFAEPMSIETLADMAGMSLTSFHRHFKNLTLMTPLQYRTQIRLQEARRMLISNGEGAGVVGLKVGYESQSQFSRDYKRMFGAPPATDTARLANGAAH